MASPSQPVSRSEWPSWEKSRPWSTIAELFPRFPRRPSGAKGRDSWLAIPNAATCAPDRLVRVGILTSEFRAATLLLYCIFAVQLGTKCQNAGLAYFSDRSLPNRDCLEVAGSRGEWKGLRSATYKEGSIDRAKSMTDLIILQGGC